MSTFKNIKVSWDCAIPLNNPNLHRSKKKRPGYGMREKLLQERSMKSGRTKHEKILAAWFMEAGEVFEEQVPIWDKYIVDFLLPTRRLIIEADGMQHCSDHSVIYDQSRDKDLITVGTVIRLPNLMICDQYKDQIMRIIADNVEWNAVGAGKFCWRLWASKKSNFNEAEISRLLKEEIRKGCISKRIVIKETPKKSPGFHAPFAPIS